MSKLIDKVKFTELYFKKNFRYKDLCEHYLPYFTGSSLLTSCLFCVAFNHSIKEQTSDYIDSEYNEIVKRMNQKENDKFISSLLKKEINGTLLPYLNNNFSLIYSLDIDSGLIKNHLIYSKYNDNYYWFKTIMLLDDNKNLIDAIDYNNIPLIFKSKLQPSVREFFEKIIQNEKETYSKDEFEQLVKDKVYRNKDGQDLFKMYLNRTGLMKG